jgi:hypothetical protein
MSGLMPRSPSRFAGDVISAIRPQHPVARTLIKILNLHLKQREQKKILFLYYHSDAEKLDAI